MNKLLRKICVVLTAFALIFPMESKFVSAQENNLITTQYELLSALKSASEGEVILVGDIDFTAPEGFFNEMMRIEINKDIIIRNGKPDGNAVFTNGSFMLKGSKIATEKIVCTFDGIVFDGAVAGEGLVYEDWERPFNELMQEYTSEVPLKAQYAISFGGNVEAEFINCTFQNYMYEYGAAMWCRYGDYTDNAYLLDRYGDYSACRLDIIVDNCEFINNSSLSAGGAVYLYGNNDNVFFNADNCKFINNRSGAFELGQGGGAVYLQYVDGCFNNCIFEENTANFDYGALSPEGDYTRGGAIYSFNSELQLKECVIFDNRSSLGGGICLTNSETVIDGCVFAENNASSLKVNGQNGPWSNMGMGGAIYMEISDAIPVDIYNTSIYRNTAMHAYGGIYGFYNEDYAGVLAQGYGQVNLYFCTIADNTCETEYDYSSPDKWLWYSHPGDVLEIPYIYTYGCVVSDELYETDFSKYITPCEENNYNYVASTSKAIQDGFDYEVDKYSHLKISDSKYEVPKSFVKLQFKDRYPGDLNTFYVGSNYSKDLYDESLPEETESQPEQTQDGTTQNGTTQDETTQNGTTQDENTEQTNGEPVSDDGDDVIKWIAAGGIILGIIIAGVILIHRKKLNNRIHEENNDETENKSIPTNEPQRVVVMTRYTEEQIEHILATVKDTQKLTPRELDVFREILMGKKQGEISYDLGISVSTVKDNAKRIYTKLNVGNKEELFIKINNEIQVDL